MAITFTTIFEYIGFNVFGYDMQLSLILFLFAIMGLIFIKKLPGVLGIAIGALLLLPLLTYTWVKSIFAIFIIIISVAVLTGFSKLWNR